MAGENSTVVSAAARRYAQAAFELAVESNQTREWTQAVNEIAAFMTEPDYRRLLENSRVGQERKQALITAGLSHLPPLALNLARLLVRKGRTALAADMATQFNLLVEAREGIARAKAVTAIPLADPEKEELARRLQAQTGQRVVLETEVDPALLGGVVVQIGDRLVDASTRARLQALRDSLVGSLA
jgi:F-type H+-transporting ATPase subunit delta